jgi:MFS family permease
MGFMTRFWEYELLCIVEVLGYVLAGPIANQALIAQWFRRQRGRAMGFAYLGLGFGGVVSPLLVSRLIRTFGWRHALGAVGLLILIVLFPVGILLTRSTPAEMGLLPDGDRKMISLTTRSPPAPLLKRCCCCARTTNFWLILGLHAGGWSDRRSDSTLHFIP